MAKLKTKIKEKIKTKIKEKIKSKVEEKIKSKVEEIKNNIDNLDIPHILDSEHLKERFKRINEEIRLIFQGK